MYNVPFIACVLTALLVVRCEAVTRAPSPPPPKGTRANNPSTATPPPSPPPPLPKVVPPPPPPSPPPPKSPPPSTPTTKPTIAPPQTVKTTIRIVPPPPKSSTILVKIKATAPPPATTTITTTPISTPPHPPPPPPVLVPSPPPPAPTGPTTQPFTTQNCPLPGHSFGRMFPNLPPAHWNVSDLRLLGQAVLHPVIPIAAAPFIAMMQLPNGRALLPDENPDIYATYTYLGQFLDHDITKESTTSSDDLLSPADVGSLFNARTPQLDLDCVYGLGPALSPELYETDNLTLKIGVSLSTAGSRDTKASDHIRAKGRALIGDPRNDENRFVASLHTFFIRYHNMLVDNLRQGSSKLTNDEIFASARKQLTLTYQYFILNDFLPTITDPAIVNSVAKKVKAGQYQFDFKFYSPCQHMPIEFSGAAYRFGHSMVRDAYYINADPNIGDPLAIPVPFTLPIFNEPVLNPATGKVGRPPPSTDLAGFSPAPRNFGIDWELMLPQKVNGAVPDFKTDPGRSFPLLGQRFSQLSYKIDNSIAQSLGLLPFEAAGLGPVNLAERNLLRGMQYGLPSGQDVARAMGITPLQDDQILIGEAVPAKFMGPLDTAARAIHMVSDAFRGKAPLWTYVLAEASNESYDISNGTINPIDEFTGQRGKNRLGPVGGRIISEVIIGLMASDPNSIFAPENAAFEPLCDLSGSQMTCSNYGVREFLDSVVPP